MIRVRAFIVLLVFCATSCAPKHQVLRFDCRSKLPMDPAWIGCFAPKNVAWLDAQPIGRAFGHGNAGYINREQSQRSSVVDELPFTPIRENAITWGWGTDAPPFYALTFDAVHSIAAYEVRDEDGMQLVIESVNSAPPRHASPSRDLSHYRSFRGIGLGSPVGDVARVFGEPKFVQLPGALRAAYYQRESTNPTVDSAFIFRHDRVVAISYAIGRRSIRSKVRRR